MTTGLNEAELRTGIVRACDWLSDIAQLKTEEFPSGTSDPKRHRQVSRKGAVRGEYYRDGKTDSFGHATSDSACAVPVVLDLFEATRNEEWRELGSIFFIQAGLKFLSDTEGIS